MLLQKVTKKEPRKNYILFREGTLIKLLYYCKLKFRSLIMNCLKFKPLLKVLHVKFIQFFLRADYGYYCATIIFMKPWRIIIIIALLLFSIVRLASTCEKKNKARLKADFSKRINSIETARSKIFSNQYASDSIQLETDQIKLYNKIIDSSIEYYRGIYSSDEKRNRQYLKVLYEYKKLYYAYKSLAAFKGNPSNSKEKKDDEYRRFQQNIQGILLDLDRYKLAAMWDIFE